MALLIFWGSNYFYPRPPRGGRLGAQSVVGIGFGISIHALREEGDPGASPRRTPSRAISIHALREEGDVGLAADTRRDLISIHALREEGDSATVRKLISSSVFLSTPSARRATRGFRCWWAFPRYFYPRPPRGGRQRSSSPVLGSCHFYPRPPRGGRPRLLGFQPLRHNFYPRPPRGGRPAALRVRPRSADFYPRPPRGGRHHFPGHRQGTGEISIHALREEGDVFVVDRPGDVPGISIHALREEGDVFAGFNRGDLFNFYPRPPRGGRLSYPPHHSFCPQISIHALREEGDKTSRTP